MALFLTKKESPFNCIARFRIASRGLGKYSAGVQAEFIAEANLGLV